MLPKVSSRRRLGGRTGDRDRPRVRHADATTAAAAIAGYSVLNDVSVRDYQYRTLQWLQGKMFEHTTPLGPWLVTHRRSGRPRQSHHVRRER